MKYLILLSFTTLFTFNVFSQEYLTFNHNGFEREYILYKPANLPPNAPLVFVLHGYTSNSTIIMTYCGMNEVANNNGFAVCYPQGSLDILGTTHWNARLTISSTDDIDFLSELAKFLQTEHDFDPLSTFTCGMSNGGFMSYTLACEKPEIFRAIASVTGTMSAATWENREIAQAIPVLQIHGKNDNVVPIDGSMTTYGGWGGAPPLDSIINFWANLNNCVIADSSAPGESTHAYFYKNSTNNNEVWYYKIDNWGHEWPGFWAINQTGFSGSVVIWDFFKQYIPNTNSVNDKLSKNATLIYPNPTNSNVNIVLKNTGLYEYKIVSLLGNIVQKGFIESNINTIDISQLEPNIYLFQMNQLTTKIIKTK